MWPPSGGAGALDSSVVRTAGLEPTLPEGKQILSLLRLPISPRPHVLASGVEGSGWQGHCRHEGLSQAAEPLPNQGVTGWSEDGGGFAGSGAQLAWIEACAREFAGVADQPALDAARVDLGMELEGEQVRAARKGLVAAKSGGGEQGAAGREIEGIAVPVQH